jgi:hypothetical protein
MTQTADVLAKIVALRDELAATLLERETAIETALLALLTGEHLLLLGPPGTAKSMLVRAICERILGASYFERLLTPVRASRRSCSARCHCRRWSRTAISVSPPAHWWRPTSPSWTRSSRPTRRS